MPTVLANCRVGHPPSPETSRDAPMRHGALGIVLGNLPEGGLCRLKRERVQQCDSAFKLILYGGRAGSRKMHRTHIPFSHAMLRPVFREAWCRTAATHKPTCRGALRS